MKVEQLLDKLIQFNTVADKENQAIVDFLIGYLNPLGFKFQLIKNKKSGKLNLLAKYNNKKPALTFSGHTDTVPESKNWSVEPFKLTQRGDKLYGLGSCDMKGGIAAFLTAVKQAPLSKLKKGLNLLFTYDEEINFTGVMDFLKKVKLKTKYVIITEPTNLVPQIAAKGVVAIKIEFIGKAAHGSVPENGVNAILLANCFLEAIQKYFKLLQKKQNKIFPVPFATFNIAKIKGGDAINKVPAKCVLELEYRTINAKQAMEIYQKILMLLKNLNCQYKIKITLQTPPMVNKNKSFIKEVEKITKQKAQGENSSNEGSYFSKYGYDCVVLGPGGEMSHKADEYISQKQLNKSIELYKKIIKKYCM